MKNNNLKGVLTSAAIVAGLVMGAPAGAADLGCKTAKLIVPWGAGGGTDIIFRIFANSINEAGAKPQLQVVNVGGQGGNKGAKEARKAKPDGCTLFAIHQSAITSYLNGRVDFTWDAFEPVAQVTNTADVFGSAGDVPWKDYEGFKKHALANPGKLLTGATFGSTSQFEWLILETKTGIKLKYVPFDGTRQRMTALLSGAIQLGSLNVTSGKKYLQGGELKAFAIAAEERSKHLPDLPTFKELGVDMVYGIVRGVVAPKGTSQKVIDHWAAAIKKATEDPKVMSQMDAKGSEVIYSGPADYRAWFEQTYKDHEKIAISIGMFKK
ncbi:MAG: tripartite tricarboxylate transporter substrate binding protein [Rhizobiaceae bacterium]